MSSELRINARTELELLLRNWITRNGGQVTRGCATCTYALRDGPFKCQIYNATPPLKVIQSGCDKYSDFDDIPF